jgi:hypothetical protein
MRFSPVIEYLSKRRVHLFALIPILGLTFSNNDFWDGTLFSFAASTRHFRGIFYSFMGQGWYEQYYLTRFFIEVAKFLDISFYSIYKVIVSALVLSLGLAFERLLRQLNFSQKQIVAGLTSMYVFPFWSVILSSVMLIHIVCLLLSLLFVLSYSKSNKTLDAKLLILFLAFEVNSLLLFTPILFIYVSFKSRIIDKSEIIKRTFIILLSGFFYYLIHNVLIGVDTDFQGYNQLIFPNNMTNLQIIGKGFLKYSTYIFVFFLFCIFAHWKEFSSLSKKYLTSDLGWHVLLFSSAVLPYLFVGKSTYVLDLDWNQRQSLLLLIVVPLIFANFISPGNYSGGVGGGKNFMNSIFLCVFIGGLVVSLILGNIAKFESRKLERSIISEISNHPRKQFYFVFVKVPNYNGLRIRSYESSFLAAESGFPRYIEIGTNPWIESGIGAATRIVSSKNAVKESLNLGTGKFDSPTCAIALDYIGGKLIPRVVAPVGEKLPRNFQCSISDW